MSQFFASGGQSIGAAASASVLPMNIQGWFPLGLSGLILQSKRLSRAFSCNTIWKHLFFDTQLSLWSNSHICKWLLEKSQLWQVLDLCLETDVSAVICSSRSALHPFPCPGRLTQSARRASLQLWDPGTSSYVQPMQTPAGDLGLGWGWVFICSLSFFLAESSWDGWDLLLKVTAGGWCWGGHSSLSACQ